MSDLEQANAQLGWLHKSSTHFGTNDPNDEFLHKVGENAPYSTVETYWWAVCDPKTGMSAHFYTQMRRALGVCSAGCWIYRGFDAHPMLIDHFNWQIGLPAPEAKGTVISIPQVGLEFEIVEPLSSAKVRYNPPGRNVQAELDWVGTMPVVTTASQDHLDQAVWCTGSITIDGERFDLAAPGFRDRTWHAPRPEDALDHPPVAYLWGQFDEGKLAFTLRGSDDPGGDVAWADYYGVSNEQLLRGGSYQKDGELRAVVAMSKRTVRDHTNMEFGTRIEIDFTDDTGEAHRLIGIPRSAMWFSPWPNVFTWFVFIDWELDGKTGVGEVQEVFWPEYARRFWPKKSVAG